VEWDDNAAETFSLNFPDVPVWRRDVGGVRGKEILEFCSLEKGELDLLDGSPPCQGYSMAGKRRINDERNDLFRQNVRLIGELGPKVFVIENVPGMIYGRMKGLFNEYMRLLRSLPYKVKCKMMNAKYYRVPQSRKRLVWIGIRNDLGIEPDYPLPDLEIVSLRQAFEKLPENKDRPLKKGSFNYYAWGMVRQGRTLADAHPKGHAFNQRRLDLNKPCATVPKHAYSMMHPTERRFLSITELKRVFSYPDDFEFVLGRKGNTRQAMERMGNSVPPRMMEAIARHVKDRILSAAGSGRAPC
jgi:DNA (cytosine-5)-methyltransferase 1